MLEWIRQHSWSTADVLALAGVAATILVAVIGPLRRVLGRSVRGGLMRAGRTERRYAAWFVGQWGQFENPYLADTEKLDLSSTFVSLSFEASDGRQESRTVATRMLANREAGNLVIQGGPGSGKSTLLKAYGVGVLRSGRGAFPRRKRPPDIPFFVQLRKFSRHLDRPGGLAAYLRSEVLVSQAGMTAGDAADFLRYVLADGRALVMLDGLDEVGGDSYQAVLEAVHAFAKDQNPDQPTHRARLIVTCRGQNFLALRDQWVPAIATTVCTLAPLRPSEIFNYLDKLRAKFKAAGGPESFFQAVRSSGTLDLHRIPLILAMSVGLYARKDYFEIPNSIAKLYQTMIEEMLDRQRFKRDPGGNVLSFQVDDKYRFLREFALRSAQGPDGFDDFGRDDLAAVAAELAPRLNAVTDPVAFVREIVDRSGLLSDVSEAGRYVFAHRSIHEHLAAEELRLVPDGATTLLRHAGDEKWRQVILFYATAEEQRSADAFLSDLVTRNPTLAGHCLGSAKASDEVATAIMDALHTADPLHLRALVAATMSPRLAVQGMAVERLETELSQSVADVTAVIGGDADAMLALLGSLADSNAAKIAALVPRIAAGIPDDPRLVEPLWRCLAAPGIEEQPACRAIVERLLTIAMEPDGLDELEKQESYNRAFLTDAVRRRAYPFTAGRPLGSNLVTLLAWAEHLGVTPAQPNRYFEAKAAGRLGRVETDRRRTLSLSLFRPGRALTAVTTTGSVIAAIVVLAIDWRVLERPYGVWSSLLAVTTMVAALVLVVAPSIAADNDPLTPWKVLFRSDAGSVDIAHIAESIENRTLSYSVFLIGPVGYAVAITPLMSVSLPWYLAAAVLGPGLLFYLTNLDMFARNKRYYLYRPNPYIDLYDDPRSRLWLRPGLVTQHG